MTTPYVTVPRVLSRRSFLRAAGVGLSLPLLEAMLPNFARGASAAELPRRMVLIDKALGLYGPDFFPTTVGRNYELTPYLQELAEVRHDFTVFSGLSHVEVAGGHASEASFLTGAPHPGTAAFRNTISLDQLAAEKIGAKTRHPYLVFGTHAGSLSWTRNGVQIPPDKDPAGVFRRLFIDGTPDEVRAQERQLEDGRSILDSVGAETAALQRRVGAADRDRLDQYFTAVREVEVRLQNAQAWSRRPKPPVQAPLPGAYPEPADIVGRTQMLLDLTHLALQTDSTRLVTFHIDVEGGVPPIPGVQETRHNVSHHGQDGGKIEQLRHVERAELQVLHAFIKKLKGSEESGNSVLDRTMVFYGSNLGNASSHNTQNLPVLLLGGGFKHGQHLAFDATNNMPLANLFVSMLQRLGLEEAKFGYSTGTLSGLDPV